MVYYYFVSTNPLESRMIKECGVKNVLVSFAYMDRFNYNLSQTRQDFDKLFMDSGAFTIRESGKDISIHDYLAEVKKQKGIPDVVAQFDVIGDLQKTIANYKLALDIGIDWMLPIAQQDWNRGIYEFEKLLGDKLDYIGLGRHLDFYSKGVDIQRMARFTIPKKYKYHGFAKAYTQLIESNSLYSADSSSWSFGARARSSPYMTATGKGGLLFGRIGKDNRMDIYRVCEQNKDDCEACGLKVQELLDGKDVALYKSAIALYYRPWFRKIGIFNKNFRW